MFLEIELSLRSGDDYRPFSRLYAFPRATILNFMTSYGGRWLWGDRAQLLKTLKLILG